MNGCCALDSHTAVGVAFGVGRHGAILTIEQGDIVEELWRRRDQMCGDIDSDHDGQGGTERRHVGDADVEVAVCVEECMLVYDVVSKSSKWCGGC